jgi:hypothetical protein
MTKDEALKMAIKAMSISMVDTKGVNDDGYWTLNIPYRSSSKALQACKEALETPECNPHPKAPHGFNRNASHSAGRYVCECEGWQLEWQGLTSKEIQSLDLDNDVISVIFQTEKLLKDKNI